MKTENMFKNCWMNVEKNVTEKNKISESKKKTKKTLENRTQRFDYKR